MKKLISTIIIALSAFIAGCNWDEGSIIATAQSAGAISQLTWFSIDNPDPQVKAVLKEVVTYITTASVEVGEGKTYLESVLPIVQEIALKQKNLTDYQKTLINAGAVVILNGIDTFLATNEKVKQNSELVNKVVAAFSTGCLSVLNMGEDCPECRNAKKVYEKRTLKCRDGKFVVVP